MLLAVVVWAFGAAVGRFCLRELYRRHVHDARRERLIVAWLSFYTAFASVRVLTHAIRAGVGPFQNLSIGGRHIHHLVWGILLLMVSGYGWLQQLGTGIGKSSSWASRVMAAMYGIGAALTLDEFALWLNLRMFTGNARGATASIQ